MTITCSGCDRPIEFTGTLTERHTLVYCDECLARLGANLAALDEALSADVRRRLALLRLRNEVERPFIPILDWIAEVIHRAHWWWLERWDRVAVRWQR